jgi:hypothetical protein
MLFLSRSWNKRLNNGKHHVANNSHKTVLNLCIMFYVCFFYWKKKKKYHFQFYLLKYNDQLRICFLSTIFQIIIIFF